MHTGILKVRMEEDQLKEGARRLRRLPIILLVFGVIPACSFYLGMLYQQEVSERAIEDMYTFVDLEQPIEGGVGAITYKYKPVEVPAEEMAKKKEYCAGTSKAQQEQCSLILLAEADARLSAKFDELVQSSIAYALRPETDKERFSGLARRFVNSQKTWVGVRDELCEVESFLRSDEDIPESVIANDCKRGIIELRISVVERYLSIFTSS